MQISESADPERQTLENSHIHQWAIGRPIFVATTALQLACVTEMALQILEWARTGEAVKKMREVVGLTDWRHLYQDAKAFWSGITDTAADAGGNAALVFFARASRADDATIAASHELLKDVPEEMLRVVEMYLHEMLKQSYRDTLRDVMDVIRDRDGSHMFSDDDMARPEVQFLLLVVFPCVLETGESPWHLYEKAKAGKYDALLDLIRIDKKVISDPAISVHLEKPTMERDGLLAQQIGKAFGDGVNYKPSRGQIKGQVGAAIIKASESLGCKLDPVDIRKLFNAIERDRCGDGTVIDQDLPEFDEGWRQAIQRGKARCQLELPRDELSHDSRCAGFVRNLVISAGDAEGSQPAWVNAIKPQGLEAKE